MIRRPLRPLARILRARERGENLDTIAAENLRLRREEARDRARDRAEGRLILLALGFLSGFALVAVQMGVVAASEPREPRAAATGNPIIGQRSDITDRDGAVLATNFETHALYAQPPLMVDPAHAAHQLARIFPELDEARLLRDFTGERRFLWLRRQLSPEQMQAVHDIGEPGLLFGPREMRLYPNGALAAHILGGAGYGREGVDSAEVIGTAGVERYFDDWLRDPANEGEALALSIDLTVQAALEEVLEGGLVLMNARGASGILMDVHTGEIVAMASLPDFDPNSRPPPATAGEAADSPIFNRALQGVYELGSVFKIFPVAQALELGLIGPETVINTQGPLRVAGFPITDFRNYGPQLTVREVIVKSSNIGTVRIAQQIGAERQRDFLRRLGFLDPVTLEMVEAPTSRPLWPRQWGEASLATISYGHGLSVSPLHLAAGYATLVNGGTRVIPTLLARDTPQQGERVISEETSALVRAMLRDVVDHGTATLADVEGYSVGGKTGTADKPRPGGGGYYSDRVIATFAGMFPSYDPRYVIVVSLDEPVETTGSEPRRTAGWTAVPVAAEIVRRTAPLLGLWPEVEAATLDGVTLTAN